MVGVLKVAIKVKSLMWCLWNTLIEREEHYINSVDICFFLNCTSQKNLSNIPIIIFENLRYQTHHILLLAWTLKRVPHESYLTKWLKLLEASPTHNETQISFT